VLLTLAAIAGLLAGCSDDDGGDEMPECRDLDPESAVLVASDNASVIADIADGGNVELIAAPQGGHILLVGARFKAAGDCRVDATGALRDPRTQRVIGLGQRPMILVRRADGFVVPRAGLDAMPNVAVCPSAAATIDVFDNTYMLEVHLATSAGDTIADLSATIVPTCTSAFCMSDCGPVR